MPRITDIQVQKNNKNRVNIYVDGEFLRGAEAISVVRNGLKTGMEISEERLREALSDSERESAFAKAVEYLSRAMRTEEQLKKFLSSKGYDSDTVDSVADKLREYGYIDDARYARLYAEQFGKTRGQRRIVNELRQKGVLTEIAMRFDKGLGKFGTPKEMEFINKEFPACQNISIDYAVMEKASNIYVLPAEFGWSDLGTWGSLHTHLQQDTDGNAQVGQDVKFFDCKNCVVHTSEERKVVLQGLDGYIVAEKDGYLLICRLEEEQRIKEFSQD